ADILHHDQLERFCKSELFQLASDGGTQVWRELRFDRFIPYDRLTKNQVLAKQLSEYSLYVQGSLDLLLKASDGSLWLCDYKTDRIRATDEQGIREQLLADHADQLRIYAEAVEGLFSRRPDHILIYSLPLGKSVELTPYIERR
ncbi:MAG: PD-(D/E)XK nuclease family protein, partial [Clostridia bacterium]|nr:PD-(D/E)XK nuclease family protein [Clostridia bacterium]